MTINKTWEECLRMWKSISKSWAKSKNEDVDKLKEKYLTRRKIKSDTWFVYNDCFFCEYAVTHRPEGKSNMHVEWYVYGAGCRNCPGRKVDEEFDCIRYNYDTDPVEFYKKLQQLNKIRLSKLRKAGAK